MPPHKFLLLLMLHFADSSIKAQTHVQDSEITSFLDERAAWLPLCLYTFGDTAISNNVTIMNHVPHDICPFDALEPDRSLVTSLYSASSFWQLGAHLAKDRNNTKRIQLSSISSVSARDFFTMAAVRNKTTSEAGVTFEMVIRRRLKVNQSMTLFSIANEFDNCVDPGFRLDVNEHQVLTFIYFLPVLEEGDEAEIEACYEQRLFSVNNIAACQLPPLLEPIERTPLVQITVTLDPSSTRGLWKTDFYMSYTDADTMERVDCAVHDEQHPPSFRILNKVISGRYRLYLGNSPRNVTFPSRRKHLAAVRALQPLDNTSSLNATERLRSMLKQRLMSLSGPRIPKAMRIFGDNSASLKILGITFPPLNEDMPLAYLRSKFSSFKKQYGDQIVDYLVNLIQHNASDPIVAQQSPTLTNQSSDGKDFFSRDKLYQGANGASFDLFHFAIYRHVVTEEQINLISRQQLLPARKFPSLKETVRIPEDSLILLNLTMLHGVFNDLRLELRGLPEFGQLFLFPNKTVLTFDNMSAFRELPLDFQRSIFFQPHHNQNNENIPLPNPVAFSRRLKPYATVCFGIARSLFGRIVNRSMEAKIDIFVDAVNDAPQPRESELRFLVEAGIPVTLNLDGDDVDGLPSAVPIESNVIDPRDVLLSKSTLLNSSGVSSNHQLLKVVRLPRFGKLFDCNGSCDALISDDRRGVRSLESFRIYRNSTKMANATHSTNLTYIYHEWSQDDLITPMAVDELWYKLSDGDPCVFSDVAVVKFIPEKRVSTRKNDEVIAFVQLEEDSFSLLNLGELDPLSAILDAKTKFKLNRLPQHGALFQYENCENDGTYLSLECIGEHITIVNAIVLDVFGRVLYIPKLDYFNFEPRFSIGQISKADYFEYQVLRAASQTNDSLLVNEKSFAARFANGLKTRRVELQIANVPDALIVAPPFHFKTDLLHEDKVPTPVVFDDPDSINLNDIYQVNLETEDGGSMLELGFSITDDNIMVECTFERPCTLLRSLNGSTINETSSSTQPYDLQFHIATQLYDPSHIEITGTKTALHSALSALTFYGVSLNEARQAKFEVYVKRIKDNDDAHQAHGTFTVTYPDLSLSSSLGNESLTSILNSQLKGYVSTFLLLLAGWLVLSNSSCLSLGCCCCCRKARKKKRKEFEQQQRLVQAQVAQNDSEYSTLLMSLANLLLAPNLLVSRCVLNTCQLSKRNRKQETEILVRTFILRSLLPLLESERQGTRLVFQLIALEYSEVRKMPFSTFRYQDFMMQESTASKALVCFCRAVGARWISSLVTVFDDMSPSKSTLSKVRLFIDKVAGQIAILPPEIVVLCRACFKMIHQNECDQKLLVVHLVFFNHFLGPALLFPHHYVKKLTSSLGKQKSSMQDIAYWITGFINSAENANGESFRFRNTSVDTSLRSLSLESQSTTTCRHKYEAVLECIIHSTSIVSEYDPSEASDVDCELMGMCLMNIHSLLDSYYPEFKQQVFLTSTSTNVGEIERIITCSSRLLKALGWPLANFHELVEYARPELLDDPVLWTGFSYREWNDRATSRQKSARFRHVKRGMENARCFLEHDYSDTEEILLEEVDEFPQIMADTDDASTNSDWPVGPLLSDCMSMLCLKAEYVGNANANFMYGIDWLNGRYEALRRVRGDGNCFFRGFIFALCEQLLPSEGTGIDTNAELRSHIQHKIQTSKSELVAIGYSDVAIDAFWETFVDYLAAMEMRSHAELVRDFQTEGGESEYLVWYMRLLTAGYMKKNEKTFQPFIEGLYPGQTVAQFCAAEVEPMGKECDQPQIAALTEALEVGVKIEYLDGSVGPGEELQSYVCSPTLTTTKQQMPVSITLLYRPGHYDILYPRK
ncbi:putative Rho GTPase activation protein [Plasmopara halstedii]